jgi:hypothetical protein
MVRAILDGRKTQTRRIVKGVPSTHDFHGWVMSSTSAIDEGKACWAIGKSPLLNNPVRVCCPFGEVGDRIWVRETWWQAGQSYARYPDDDEYGWYGSRRVLFAVDGNPPNEPNDHYPKGLGGGKFSAANPNYLWRKRPSIHMPRWASRITLEITGVRVERIASISTESARAEGYPAERAADGGDSDPWLWFRDLWDGIYPEQSFKDNPWVWVIEFRRIEGGA